MARSSITYEPLSGIAMRFPQYPLDLFLRCLDNEEEMLKVFRNNGFKNAILFSSPALYKEYKRLLSGEMTGEKDKLKVKLSLLKYFARMSSRCTPFASLASCGYVNWGNSQQIRPDEKIVERFRLDMLYCCMISQQMLQDKSIRENLSFRMNDTIYVLGNRLRYISYTSHGFGRTFQVRELTKTRPLAMLIKKVSGFIPFQSLATLLQDSFELSNDAATDYLHNLIDHQLLVSDIEPSVTGDDMLSRLLKRVAPFHEQWKCHLVNVQECLAKLSSSSPSDENEIQLNRIKDTLATVGIKTNPKYLIQLDSFSQPKNGTIDRRIVKQLKQGLEFLCRIIPVYQNGHLERFKQRFSARYQDQEIPLIEALDPDIGIGYIHTQDRISNPLIDGLQIPSNSQVALSQEFSPFQQILLKKLVSSDWQRTGCINLSDKDISEFPLQSNDLPVTLAAMFELLSQTDNGEYLIGNLRFWGGCAANLLGRFAYGDDRILDLVNQITEHEKKAFNDSVVAEIAHVPQNRTGNILSRPNIREYEILYLTNSQIDNANQIPVNDLNVSVRNGKVRLRSVRLNKYIVPRLTTAHNYSGTDTSPIYHFLCDIQHQNGRSSLAFRWGPLSNLEHLPRVMYRNIIFSQEQWVLRCNQFPFKKGQITTRQLLEWAQRYNLPRYVSLVAGDNKLLVDTRNILSIESMMSEIGKRGKIILEEFIPCIGTTIRTNGRDFMNECIVPLIKTKHE